MAAEIISSAVYCPDLIHSSIELASRAGDKCIEKSEINKEKVGILIYTGAYRDKNVVEPALACIIQKNMGINTDPVGKRHANITFSFDLSNTACGFLYAVQAADGFINSGRANYVLITSSDVHPSQEEVEQGYPFSHIGSAALIAKARDKKTGFQNYFFKTSNDGYQGYYSYAAIYDYGVEGRKSVIVDIDKNFERKSLDFAVSAVKEFSEEKKVNLADVKFLITSQFHKDFGKNLASAIGFDENRVIQTFDKYGNTHTSALTVGYDFLKQSGFLWPGDKVLFVCVGAGLTAGVSLYVA